MVVYKKQTYNRCVVRFLYTCFLVTIIIFYIFSFPTLISSSDLHPRIANYKIGIITDIHAASQHMRATENPDNIIYPYKYKTLLPEVLSKMKAEGVKVIINLGDVTNNESMKHAGEAKRMIEEEEIEAVWVKGNHETVESKIMSDVLDVSNNYYFMDKESWRIIVLDSSEGPDNKDNFLVYAWYDGGIGDAQLSWLREALKTDKDVIIAMHHPIWNKETIGSINPVYKEFEEAIENSGNVRYVFSGHWHTPYWERELNGIKYYGISAFILDGAEGFYKTLDLPSYHYSSYEPT